jgi:hypothetical protein
MDWVNTAGKKVPQRTDVIAAAIVLCGHALLIVLFARMRESEREHNELANTQQLNRSIVSFLDSPQSTRRANVVEPAIARAPMIEVLLPQIAMPQAPSTTSVSTAPDIDWQGEAQASVHNAIRAQQAPKPRGFEQRESPAPPPKRRPFAWDPSPGRFGMSGGLPYMEIGKRCAIGLGFFGCGIGELPPPNGRLFDGMDDPDRERSSVPENP